MILHALQDNHPRQYLTEEALEETVKYLKMTRSNVFGVAKYYSMFSLKPRGRYIIRLCASAVCELTGGIKLQEYLEKTLEIKTGETTPCGLFTLELSECLGQCQDAPSMMINREVFNNLNAGEIDRILDSFRKQ